MELAVKRSLAKLVADQESSSSSEPCSSQSTLESNKMDDYVEDIPFDEKNLEPSVIAHVSNEKNIAIANLRNFERNARATVDEFIELLFQNNNDTADFDDLMNMFESLTEHSANITDDTHASFIKALGVRFTVFEAKIRNSIQRLIARLNQEHDKSDEDEEDQDGGEDNEDDEEGDDGDGDAE